MTEEKKLNIWELIRNRFPATEYALLPEVRDAAGFSASRSADGIAMNLWPSRGLEFHGLEIKSYRGDWLRELKNPKKAEAMFKFCDRWWIVADGEDIVKEAEVPKTWGLLVAKKNRIRCIIEAPKLKPISLDRHIVASLLKRATHGMISRDSIEVEIEKAAKVQVEYKNREIQRLEKELLELNVRVDKFKKSSGVSLHRGWDDHTKIGEAVRYILNGGAKHLEEELSRLLSSAKLIHANIENVLAAINIKQEPEPVEPEDE